MEVGRMRHARREDARVYRGSRPIVPGGLFPIKEQMPGNHGVCRLHRSEIAEVRQHARLVGVGPVEAHPLDAQIWPCGNGQKLGSEPRCSPGCVCAESRHQDHQDSYQVGDLDRRRQASETGPNLFTLRISDLAWFDGTSKSHSRMMKNDRFSRDYAIE